MTERLPKHRHRMRTVFNGEDDFHWSVTAGDYRVLTTAQLLGYLRYTAAMVVWFSTAAERRGTSPTPSTYIEAAERELADARRPSSARPDSDR